MKESNPIDLRADVKTNIYFHKKGPLCKNCGHPLVLVNEEPHHLYEFINWSESKTQRKLRCDSFRPDGRTSCSCEHSELDDKAKDDLLRERILSEMVRKEGEVQRKQIEDDIRTAEAEVAIQESGDR